MDSDTTQTVQPAETKHKVPTLAEREEVVSRDFSGFRLRLSRDAVGKKKLSNRLTITVPDSRSESVIKMTVREARALQTFLNRYLPNN
jgi:hypothetical protein